MKLDTYQQAKRLVDASIEIKNILGLIETKIGLGEDLSAGVCTHFSKDNLDWLVGVCKERLNELLDKLDEL